MTKENENVVKYTNPLPVEREPISVDAVVNQMEKIQELLRRVMKEGIDNDFAVIPGCKKKSLLQPGAIKIGALFQLAPDAQITARDLPGGHREYEAKIILTNRSTGHFVGSGVGVCSTSETKWKFRTQDTGRPVPQEYWNTRDSSLLGGSQFSVRKVYGKDSKQEWHVFEKIEHDNPADYYNTAKKIAEKRAHVDAIIKNVPGVSDLFTQDIEELPGMAETLDDIIPKPKESSQNKQPESKIPEKEQQIQDIISMTMEMCDNDVPAAQAMVVEFSEFIGKDSKTVTGLSDPAKLSPGRLKTTWGRLHDKYKSWQREKENGDPELPF